MLQVTAGDSCDVQGVDGPSIFIATEGRGTISCPEVEAQELSAGSVYFLGANTGTCFALCSLLLPCPLGDPARDSLAVVAARITASSPLKLYKAFCEINSE